MGVAIEIVYEGDLMCRAVHGPSGEAMTTEAPVDNGGTGSHFSPTDLMATALGSCQLTIAGIVAGARGLDIRGARVRVMKSMVADPLRRIGTLDAVITLPEGLKLTQEDRIALEDGAARCPVKQSLHPAVEVSVRFEYPD